MASVSRCRDLASFEKMPQYLDVVALLFLFLDVDVMVFMSLNLDIAVFWSCNLDIMIL